MVLNHNALLRIYSIFLYGQIHKITNISDIHGCMLFVSQIHQYLVAVEE